MERRSRQDPPDERRQQTIEVVATFTALMHAHERGELAKAADARQALARLGVVVRVDRANATAKGGPRRG